VILAFLDTHLDRTRANAELNQQANLNVYLFGINGALPVSVRKGIPKLKIEFFIWPCVAHVVLVLCWRGDLISGSCQYVLINWIRVTRQMRGEVTTLTTPTTSTGSFWFRCNICRWRYVHKSLNPAQNRWHSVFSDPSRNFDCFNNVTSQTLFHWLFRGLKLIQFNSFIHMRYAKKKTCGFIDEGVSRSVRLSDSHTQFYFYLLLCLALTLFFCFLLPPVSLWSEIHFVIQ